MKKILLISFILPFLGFSQNIESFLHDGLNRKYILYIPTSLPIDAPLVFVGHGYGGSAQSIMNYSGMNSVADQNGFAVCYPEGIQDNWGQRFWNVGYPFTANISVDDVGFILALANYLQSAHQLSSDNTFFTGMSNGAEFCYLLACEAPYAFRAIAPVAGTIFPNGLNNNICNPSESMPVFETHGTNDNVTLYQGDTNDQFWGEYLGIDSIIDFFVLDNNLTDLAVDTFSNINNNQRITISYKYSSKDTYKEVWLYKAVNGGHDWSIDDINISEEIWSFFNKMSQNNIYLNETYSNIDKHLIKVVNILGKEVEKTNNQILFYIYDDGTVEKRFEF